MQIPVVDYRDERSQWAFAHSLRETGFAVLSHHPLDNILIEKLYESWMSFFKSDEKHRYEFDAATHSGFISTQLSETAKGHSIKDLKEFFHYYPGRQCPGYLLKDTQALYDNMNALAKQLLGWLEAELPTVIAKALSMPLGEMIRDSADTLLRILHYPPLPGAVPPGAVRAAAHEDINLITLLPAATAKGLQVKNVDGQWIDVPCEPGWLIVNVGDMLQECSQGYFRSTSHRVINPGPECAAKSRVSCPLFLHPRKEVVLSKRYTARSYCLERYQELGLAAE